MTRYAFTLYKRQMPAMLYTLGAFGLILILARLKVPLALAILAGATLLGLSLGLKGAELPGVFLQAASQPETISLVLITAVLLTLSRTMRISRQLEEIVSLVKALMRRPAVAMAALPALIGLLPMPGGALFSAPMVDSAAGGASESRGRLSAINYWFRHVWEYWWPLYPGVILATELTESSFGTFIGYQIPLSIFMIFSGLYIFRNMHPDLHATQPPPQKGTKRKLLWLTSSIWIIPIVWVVIHFLMRLLPEDFFPQHIAKAAKKYLPIAIGLLFSLFWTIRLNRMKLREMSKVFSQRDIYIIAALVLAVMIFQGVLGTVDAGRKIAAELQEHNVPIVLVIAILPFIAGMITGLAIGFVGISFPIVLSLVAAMPSAEAMRPYAVLAYACGHMGQMASPLHLCYILSNRYFNTSFGPVYKRLLLPIATAFALAVGYFLILKIVLN